MLVAELTRRNNIGRLLDDANMSIYRLAKEVGMEYKSVHTLVNSETIPSQTHYETLRKIADALDVRIDDLEVEANTENTVENSS